MASSDIPDSRAKTRRSPKIARPLSVVYRPLTDLVPDPSNPRRHSSMQIRQIANSIKAFGFNVPILITAERKLFAGHGRWQAAQLLGMTQVPTIKIEHLSEAQIRAFMIADNRLTENSDWDEQLLAEEIKALSEVELNFDLETIGFEMSEIDLMIQGLTPANQAPDDPADAIPESVAKPQITQAGDLWVLEHHRVLCGDARDDTNYSVLMKGRRAAVVFTDPPYNDPIDGYVTGFGRIHHAEFAVASGEMSKGEFTDFLTKILAQSARHIVQGALLFICMDWRHLGELISAARALQLEFKNLCVWVKENAGQGSLYRSQHELVFVFKSGNKPHRNNIQLGKQGRYRTNVWQYRRVNSLSRGSEEGDLSQLHPTIKPVGLVADVILDVSARRDVVLDPFLGSGTTVIAAERTGRVCYGMELDARYVDTIVRRWQTFTGGRAVQESTGRTFNNIEEELHGRAN